MESGGPNASQRPHHEFAEVAPAWIEAANKPIEFGLAGARDSPDGLFDVPFLGNEAVHLPHRPELSWEIVRVRPGQLSVDGQPSRRRETARAGCHHPQP